MAKMGRKVLYEEHIKPYFSKIIGWRRQGKSEEWIYARLGICKTTWYKYKKQYPEFRKICVQGKEELILALENSLFEEAIHKRNIPAIMFALNNYGGAMTEKDKQMLEIKRQELELKREISGKLEELATSSDEVAKIVAEVRSAYVD